MSGTNLSEHRVVIIAKCFPPTSLGQSARAMQMAKVVSALHDCGLQVEVVAGIEDREKDRPEWPFPVHYVSFKAAVRKGGSLARIVGLFYRAADTCLGRDWVHRAIRIARQRIAVIKADVLLTASNPGESHAAGLAIKRKTGIPWVAFLSDPWPLTTLPKPYRPAVSLYRRMKETVQGRRVMRRCDAVAMPGRYGLLQVERRLGVPVAHKGYAVGHVGRAGNPPENPVRIEPRIIHVGDLTHRFSLALIQAVKTVAEESPEQFKGLLCVGGFNSEYEAAVRAFSAEKHIQFTGFVSGPEAGKLAASSQALLVIEADMPESPFLPSKFADYARTGRPILAITPLKSAIRDYLNQYGGGIAVTHSVQEITEALRKLFTDGELYAHNTDNGESALAACFSPEAVAEGYFKMFETVYCGTQGRNGSR